MGEGHYRLIGVGCLNAISLFPDDDGDTLVALMDSMENQHICLRHAYESEPDYLCVLMALDNAFLLSCRGHEQLFRFSHQHIPDLLRAAAPVNPHLDVPALLTEFEQRPVLSQQIRELSRKSMEYWRNQEFAEHERLEGEIYQLQLKTCEWHRFSGVLPSLPPSLAEQIPAEVISATQKAWEVVREVAASGHGVTLPAGKLIFADDWD